MITKTELLNLAPKHELMKKLEKLSLPNLIIDEAVEQIVFWSDQKAKTRYAWDREDWIAWHENEL